MSAREASEFPRRVTGDRRMRHFSARVTPTDTTEGTCEKCGGRVRRSWRTGILHDTCRVCRELVLLYGPSIRVSRIIVERVSAAAEGRH